ncbi:hypothetical protein B0H67DRAFT_551173 [Lasiosphaeris hirsuta]|uniref:Uncharacterized protein n=1 Tax=Lasiosphaeris hirsuta TaxID=260670 RepID=A0AA40B0Y6_9PEZI|nr:hypothetical protein B0H67DRAFT_551173 [Lasiosphaeris hirsuta]
MKVFALLWSLTWAIVGVSAYDLYGGYERIIYYNAYRMDWGKSGGDAKRMTIGSGCSNGGKPCDLLDFVKYINHDGKLPVLDMKNAPAGWDPLNMKADHVDWAAKALRDSGSTGIYEPNKIYKGVSRNDVDGLFRKVGEFISGAQAANGVPPNSVQCAQAAVKVWANLRTWAQGLAFMKHLEGLYPGAGRLETVDKEVGKTGDKVQTIDLTKSMAKIKAQPNMADYKYNRDFKQFAADDPGHAEKVNLARDAKAAITGEC